MSEGRKLILATGILAIVVTSFFFEARDRVLWLFVAVAIVFALLLFREWLRTRRQA
jgi:hypothetical protein